MAIMVATDVVSDVLGAADPLTSRIATDRLTRLQSTTGTEFSAEAAAVRAERGAVAQAKTFGPLPPGDAPAIMRPVTSGDSRRYDLQQVRGFHSTDLHGVDAAERRQDLRQRNGR